MERIILAFTKNEIAQKVRRMLDGSGFEIFQVCHSKAELMRSVVELENILIIMGYKLPDAVADDVYEDLDASSQALMVLAKAEQQQYIQHPDLFVVTLPVNRQQLIDSIHMVAGKIERQKKKKRNPEEQKIVEEAKAYLIETYRMSEEKAHRFIQKRSMDTGVKFADIARMILEV
jgi:AmiR/NasT family two-component response regulator